MGLFDSDELKSAKRKQRKYEDLIEKIDYLMLQIQNARMCAISLDVGYLERDGQPNCLVDDRMRLTFEMFTEMRTKQTDAIDDIRAMKQSAQTKLSYAISDVNSLEAAEE
ncbi:hypothetical protein [Listeria costaricensis]|uniref:hypothetical protein n=1 Tax=Listeria costaricensis TaxID=2026604 RepID=UPI0013C50596|nr:hypothetical protein [Listeria costaricensis]